MKTTQQIAVATLNFSGINTNPFQYDDGSELFKDLKRNFILIRDAEFPDLKKWAGALLDKNFKTNRFTVLFGDQFNQNIGDKLINKQKFQFLWKKFYNEAVEKDKIQGRYKAKPSEQLDVLMMDYAFYRAVAMHVYHYDTLQKYNTKFQTESSSELKDFLAKKRNSPPFKLNVKKELTIKYYRSLDVLFLQEAGSVVWQQQKDYTVVKHEDSPDSVIIYRTQKFGQVDEKQTRKWHHLLNINNDTAMVLTKKRFLLASSHFKSNPPFYYQQEAELCKVLNYLFDYYHTKPYKVIFGLDSNHYVQKIKTTQQTFICPVSPNESTSIKKRSYIQAQMNKADQQVDEVKDHLFTSLKLKSYRLQSVDGTLYNNQLLPNDKHPYDHIIVRAQLLYKEQ